MKKCPNCGSIIATFDGICSYCGYEFTWGDSGGDVGYIG